MPAGPFNFASELYPITLRAFGVESGRELWTTIIEEPERLEAVRIPPLARIHGERVQVRVEFADGTVEE